MKTTTNWGYNQLGIQRIKDATNSIYPQFVVASFYYLIRTGVIVNRVS